LTIAATPKDQWIQIVEDYLGLAQHCVDQQNPDGSIPHGYSATLLLLCATDAIGHGLLDPSQDACRLDVLMCPPFSQTLNMAQIKNLKEFFRNGLAHAGVMAPQVYLRPEATGLPFNFDTNGVLTEIRVPVLNKIVQAGWRDRDPDAFHSKLRDNVEAKAALITHPIGHGSTLNFGASGQAHVPIVDTGSLNGTSNT
jgi:hypothetical protein